MLYSTIKNIVFDYGNVIFAIDFARAQHSFSRLGISHPEQIFSHASHAYFFDAFERGHLSPADFRDQLRAVAEAPQLTDQAIDNAWNSGQGGIGCVCYSTLHASPCLVVVVYHHRHIGRILIGYFGDVVGAIARILFDV